MHSVAEQPTALAQQMCAQSRSSFPPPKLNNSLVPGPGVEPGWACALRILRAETTGDSTDATVQETAPNAARANLVAPLFTASDRWVRLVLTQNWHKAAEEFARSHFAKRKPLPNLVEHGPPSPLQHGGQN